MLTCVLGIKNKEALNQKATYGGIEEREGLSGCVCMKILNKGKLEQDEDKQVSGNV